MGGRKLLGVLVTLGMVGGRADADTRIIDSHTALVPAHGEVRLEIGAGPDGSVLTGANVGLFERMSIVGCSIDSSFANDAARW